MFSSFGQESWTPESSPPPRAHCASCTKSQSARRWLRLFTQQKGLAPGFRQLRRAKIIGRDSWKNCGQLSAFRGRLIESFSTNVLCKQSARALRIPSQRQDHLSSLITHRTCSLISSLGFTTAILFSSVLRGFESLSLVSTSRLAPRATRSLSVLQIGAPPSPGRRLQPFCRPRQARRSVSLKVAIRSSCRIECVLDIDLLDS